MQKWGPLKCFDSYIRGAVEKVPNLTVNIEFIWFSMGLTYNFHGKNGDPEIFGDLKGWGRFVIFFLFFASNPRYTVMRFFLTLSTHNHHLSSSPHPADRYLPQMASVSFDDHHFCLFCFLPECEYGTLFC